MTLKPTISGERLQKHLANLGVASRRTIERWIVQQKISVNGKVAQLGDKVLPTSCITVNGRIITAKPPAQQARVILYHKPQGEISTRKDPQQRHTVFDRLPKLEAARWVAVGRLDINTSGLLLFTDDGQLANRLMHPRFGLQREYLCRVYGKVNTDSIKRLTEGMLLGRDFIRFQQVQMQSPQGDKPNLIDNTRRNIWYSVVVSEGKYREIRRMWAAIDCQLSRLIRVRYGNMMLPETLKPGQWLELSASAIAELLAAGVEREKPKSVATPAKATAPTKTESSAKSNPKP